MRTLTLVARHCVSLAGGGSAAPRSSSSPSSSPSPVVSVFASQGPSSSISIPATFKDGSKLKARADATCEVLSHRVAMAKRFAIVEILLLQSPDRLESTVSVR